MAKLYTVTVAMTSALTDTVDAPTVEPPSIIARAAPVATLDARATPMVRLPPLPTPTVSDPATTLASIADWVVASTSTRPTTPPHPAPGAEPTHTVAPLVIVAAELIVFVLVAVATPTLTPTATPDETLTPRVTATTSALNVGVPPSGRPAVARTVTDKAAVTDDPSIVATTTSLRVLRASAPAPVKLTPTLPPTEIATPTATARASTGDVESAVTLTRVPTTTAPPRIAAVIWLLTVLTALATAIVSVPPAPMLAPMLRATTVALTSPLFTALTVTTPAAVTEPPWIAAST